MKKTMSMGMVMVLFTLSGLTTKALGHLAIIKNLPKQEVNGKPAKNAPLEQISFRLKNNSLLPTKLSVISYQPNQTGNGTQAFYLAPYGSKSFKFPIGTKIYLANQDQVNEVMGGKSLSADKPFLVVSKNLNGSVVKINP